MLESGKFILGVNYWTSHAATKMWTQWNAEVVEKDLAELSGLGIKSLRVFPLWPDFQPVMVLRSNCAKGGYPRDYAFIGERPLPSTEAGAAGVDETMVERFELLADIALKHGLKLIVPLLNGHMTFRDYLPPAVDGLDAFTDPESLMWQTKFVRYFVKRMKHHEAIWAWELGNECNCMSVVDTRAAAWSWTAHISDAIRAQDASRPVISGMHSLQLHDQQYKPSSSNWLISDQAENCDILTTHPYTMWRNYINCDEPNTLRWVMLATTENQLYSDIGEKVSFVEEIGTLRRTFSDFTTLGNQLRNILWLLWANDARALLWWCAFDQTGMEFPPYDWDEAGMEHGIMRCDYQLNPTGKAIAEFAGFLEKLPIKKLPLQVHNAVCILGREQEHYELVNSTNILAKQAGLNLKFTFCNNTIPDAPLYVIPCVKRKGGLNRASYRELIKRVESGATLYMSFDYNVCIPEMPELLGVEIVSRKRSEKSHDISLSINKSPIEFTIKSAYDFTLEGRGAKPLDKDGLFWEYRRGKGRIVVAALPLEMELLAEADSFQKHPVFKFYRYLGEEILFDQAVHQESSEIIVSEHPLDDRKRYVIVVNCSPDVKQEELCMTSSWRITGIHSDNEDVRLHNNQLLLPGNTGVLLILER